MFADYEFEKKSLKSRDFVDLTSFWSAIELQKYITRSRSDTSDTSHLQKWSPNVVCYFWSPCRTTIRLKSRFLPLHSSISLTFPVQIPHSTQAMVRCSSHLGGGHKQGTNTAKLHSITTQNNMRKPQSALEFTRKFLNTANRLVFYNHNTAT